MPDISNTFDSDEQLANVEVEVSGAETATLTDADYTESGSGPYTYTATYNASSDGEYTFTLNTAEDAAGNDGASGQSTTVTVGGYSVLDHFDDGAITGWTEHVGSWSESGSVMSASATSGSVGAAITKDSESAIADATYRALVNYDSQGSAGIGVVGRYDRSTGAFYQANIGDFNNGILALYYWDGSSFSTIKQDDTITISDGTPYYVELEASGTNLTAAVYDNAETLIASVTATDTNLSSGYWGLRMNGTGFGADTFEKY